MQNLPSGLVQLMEDGYTVIDDAIPISFLSKLRKWSQVWINRTVHPKNWKYQGSDIKITGIKHQSRRHEFPIDPMVDRIVDHSADFMSNLLIEDLCSGGVFQIISKPPMSSALYWHQDWGRWTDPISLSPWPQQVFLNWYLTDTNVENGCLRLIPGTHKSRIDLHRHLVNAHEGGGYDIKETNEWMFCDHPQAIDLHVKAGQLVIGDARLLHATHPNRSTERRTVLLGWYYRKSNEAPEWWRGTIPNEIRRRDKNEPNVWDRTPGKYLR